MLLLSSSFRTDHERIQINFYLTDKSHSIVELNMIIYMRRALSSREVESK